MAIHPVVEIPGTRTLVDTPKRAFTFLRALGKDSRLRSIMKKYAYTQDDHLEGWRLLFKASGSESEQIVSESPAATAIRELDAWDEAGFHTAHAALARRFPSQAEFVFHELAPTQGPAAVLGVKKFLDRLDVLEKGDGRSETHDADQKAIETLAARGFDAGERARLRTLVEIAQSEPSHPPAPSAADSHQEDLAALHAWYMEWTEVARAVVSARADRITLGVSRRKKRGTKGDTETPVAIVPGSVHVPSLVPPGAPALTSGSVG